MTKQEIADAIKRWRHDPVAMVKELFHAEPDPWQADGLRAFATDERIAVKSAKGPGKTAFLAWCGWNFLLTRPKCNIAAMSVSADNLRDGLWKELAKWQQHSQLLEKLFVWQKTRIEYRAEPSTWWLASRSWAKQADATAQVETLAGLHADYVGVLMDETGSYPQALMATAEAVLASCIEGRIVQVGNPTMLDGPLYRACVPDRDLWTLIQITGDPNDPKRSPRISVEWANQQIRTYGAENPWVKVNVFGEFPPSSINTLLGPEDVEKAMKRHLRPDEFDFAQKRLGVDVARFSDDRTVIWPRQGPANFPPVVMRGAKTTEISARVALAIKKWGAELVLVDDTGHWGHGVIDQLSDAGFPCIGVQFHAPAADKRYKNRRAEMWLQMAEGVKGGAALPPMPELPRELSTPQYTFVNGQFQLEPKDDIKARLGSSPDLGDAFALTYSIPDMPSELMQQARGAQTTLTEYDEYA